MKRVVARSGTLTAVWRPIPDPPGEATFLVNYLCGPCTRAVFIWGSSATYEVDVTGPSGTTTFPTGDPTIAIEDLIPSQSYSVTIVSVKDGIRSDASSTSGRRYTFTPVE